VITIRLAIAFWVLPGKSTQSARHVQPVGLPYICKKKKMQQQDPEAFYSRLREELLKDTDWPSKYLFKFIIPSDPEKIAQIQAIFDNTGAVVESKKSKAGKYTSLSITVYFDHPDQVIEKYVAVGKVEGVISL
jgi:putative lipoic acid-binding regulatory protein